VDWGGRGQVPEIRRPIGRPRAAQADVDAAVALLDAAFEQGVAALPYVAIDPRLDRLRRRSAVRRAPSADRLTTG
jgi:hypothetical protein